MTEKEHQYYRRCTLCDPDLIVCPVCNGSGKVARPSGEDDLLVDEGTYPVSLGRLRYPKNGGSPQAHNEAQQ